MSDNATPRSAAAWPIWFGPLLVLCGGICIGFAPIGLRFGTDGANAGDLGPQGIALWRFLFAIPVLFLVVIATQKRLPHRPNKFVLIAGVCFALNIAFWHWSLTLTTVANATFIVSLGNVAVGLTAWIFLKERPAAIWGVAVLLAIVGAAALSLGGVNDEAARPFALRGDLLAIMAAIMVSGYLLASKVARRSLGGFETIFWLTVVEAVVLFGIVAISGEPFWPANMSSFYAPLFLALVVQVCGQSFIIVGVAHTPASIAGLLLVSQPVVAAILSWQLFDETLVAIQLGGCGLIITGILIAQLGNRRTVSNPSHVGAKDTLAKPETL